MSRSTWKALMAVACVAFVCEACGFIVLSFAPGWANGWPFGLTIHQVWSGGMAVLLFLMTATVACGIGAAAGLYGVRFQAGRRWGGRAFAIWLAVSMGVAIAMSCLAYPAIYSTTLQMWPNGYNP